MGNLLPVTAESVHFENGLKSLAISSLTKDQVKFKVMGEFLYNSA